MTEFQREVSIAAILLVFFYGYSAYVETAHIGVIASMGKNAGGKVHASGVNRVGRSCLNLSNVWLNESEVTSWKVW